MRLSVHNVTGEVQWKTKAATVLPPTPCKATLGEDVVARHPVRGAYTSMKSQRPPRSLGSHGNRAMRRLFPWSIAVALRTWKAPSGCHVPRPDCFAGFGEALLEKHARGPVPALGRPRCGHRRRPGHSCKFEKFLVGDHEQCQVETRA